MSGTEEDVRTSSSRQRKRNKYYENDSFVYPAMSPRASPRKNVRGSSVASTPLRVSPILTPSELPPEPVLKPIRLKIREPSPPVEHRKKKRSVSRMSVSKNYEFSGLSALVRDKELGVRLRNLLKLPKAHKWVCYEWFYSDLDRCIFEGENDFQVCLRESFPQLKTNKLTRIEWCKIRRLLGRPRRCSEAFFREEREELARKRIRVRLIQQRKILDLASVAREVPDVIPLPAVIGTRVTARLRYPQDGIFLGRVEAFDTSNDTYRISFQRPGLGTRSVPDFEVLVDEVVNTICISEVVQRSRHRPVVPPMVISPIRCPPTPLFSVTPLGSPNLTNDVSFASDNQKPLKLLLQDGSLGNFPVTLLSKMVRLSKVLNRKRAILRAIGSMNAEVERRRSTNQSVGREFQKKYAKNIIDLEDLNKYLQELDAEIQSMLTDICPEVGLDPPVGPEALKAVSYSDAKGIVNAQKDQRQAGRSKVPNSVLELITGLTSIMLQVKCLADGERNANEFIALTDTIGEIKQSLHPDNEESFRDCVETHLELIQSGLSQLGNLHAFMSGKPVKPAVV